MEKILFTSEEFVRTQTQISDNIQGKFLLPSIREAQEMYLQTIIGTALYKRLEELISSGDIEEPENEIYKQTLDLAQYFLAYKTVSLLCVNSSVHINNFGLNTPSDENLQPLSINQILKMEDYFTKRADFYARRVQEFCAENCSRLPELRQNEKLDEIKANLSSAASSSLWLGGVRGKARYGTHLRDIKSEIIRNLKD